MSEANGKPKKKRKKKVDAITRMTRDKPKITAKTRALLEDKARGMTAKQLMAKYGYKSTEGPKMVARTYKDILAARREEIRLEYLQDPRFEKMMSTQLKVASDPKHRAVAQCGKNCLDLVAPKESSRSEVHVGDKYEDKRTAVQVNIGNLVDEVQHLSMEELQARVAEREKLFLRPPAP